MPSWSSRYKDGANEVLSTDEQWHTAPGPITFSCIYGGEDYDARLQPPGWDLPGFAETGWAPAKAVQGPGGRLKGLSCAAPPIRAFEVLKPVGLKPLRADTTVYDLGQNVSLMPRLAVKGPPGAVVKIIPAELIKPDGSVAPRLMRRRGLLLAIHAGRGRHRELVSELLLPRLPLPPGRGAAPPGQPLPTIESLVGVVVHSSSPAVGDFECSNPLFNRIRTLVRWAQRSNMMSLMTDCPHREKLGWLEEDHLNGPSLRYEFDLARLFTKIMNDMADSQRQTAWCRTSRPNMSLSSGGFQDSPEWGSAFILVPWQQYEFTGDFGAVARPLRRHEALRGLSRQPRHEQHRLPRPGRLVLTSAPNRPASPS